MHSALFATVLLCGTSLGFGAQVGPGGNKIEHVDCWGCADPPLDAKMNTTLNIGPVVAACKSDWKTITSNLTKDYFCVKVNADGGAVARGLMTKDDVVRKFGWTDPPQTGCKGGLTYNPEGRKIDEVKGELCLCSTQRCNSAPGLQISVIVTTVAFVVAAMSVVS
jgi:hypothetical protein